MNQLLRWPYNVAILKRAAERVAKNYRRGIPAQALVIMCQTFRDREWIGQFTYSRSDPRGKDERILALCMAAAILENP